MTLMDEVARSTLREANDTLQDIIDTELINNEYAKKIPIFDRIESHTGAVIPSPITYPTQSHTGAPLIYDNYYFGTKSTEVLLPEQCTIAR